MSLPMPLQMSLPLSLSLSLVVACGGAYRGNGGAATTPVGAHGVEAAALPYTILDGRTGRQVAAAEFWGKLGASRVVCVGEEHPNPHHHWAQLEVVSHLTPQGPYPQLALAMEMFQRPFQAVLEDYAASRIDEAALLSRTGWAERWGYDFEMYRPMLARVIKMGGHLLALNPAKETVKRISRQGLESLTAEERAALPELKLDDAAHRAWFDGVMAEMGGDDAHTKNPHQSSPSDDAAPDPTAMPDPFAPPSSSAPSSSAPPASPHGSSMPAMPSADRIYAVQVLWDESMADGAVRWVKADPSRRAIVIAGNGHCHDVGVVSRIRRRGVADVISIRPIVDNGEGNVAALLARPMNDYLFVMTLPATPAGP
jgi:uncharacterized iron-regulated protein